jgi:adenylate kinase
MRMIIIGPQGSGKGTYASRLSAILGVPHISTGDLLREEVKNDTELGKKANDYMEKGLLVPDELVIEILKKRISQKDAKKGFILDGFPRNQSQAKMLDDISKIDVVVELAVPEWILLNRLSSRRTCKGCGEIYNIVSVKPKKEGMCDKCGGELIQRSDETSDAIRERLSIYRRDTLPLIDYYKNRGILKQVSCDRLESPPEENVANIIKVLGVKNV